MNQQQFLATLKQAAAGLPPETVARTLAYYEQRFIDGMAAGQTEDEVARDLDDPRKIALTLRTSVHLAAVSGGKSPRRLGRLVASALGLSIFNLFMVVPALVFASLLAAVFASGFAFYASGIVLTSSGLAGANEVVLPGPLRHGRADDEGGGPTVITVGTHGIQVQRAPAPETDPEGDAEAPPERDARAALREVREVAAHGVRFYNDMDNSARTANVAAGLGLVIASIGLFLVGLLVTALSARGLRRYVAMNIALLKNS